MKLKSFIKYLEQFDEDIDIIISGLVYSSNVDSETGNFYIYNEEKPFTPHVHCVEEKGRFIIGPEV